MGPLIIYEGGGPVEMCVEGYAIFTWANRGFCSFILPYRGAIKIKMLIYSDVSSVSFKKYQSS